MRSIPEIAWAAGFLEGEGSFTHTSNSPVISCPQVQREPLERLQNLFGGKIYFSEGRIWRWHLYGSNAVGVMMTLYTFMSPKRRAEIEETVKVWKDARTIRPKDSPYCIHGHDMRVTGVHRLKGRGPRCAECGRITARRWDQQRRQERLAA